MKSYKQQNRREVVAVVSFFFEMFIQLTCLFISSVGVLLVVCDVVFVDAVVFVVHVVIAYICLPVL